MNILSGPQLLNQINYDSCGVKIGNKLTKSTLSINAVYPCGTGISRKGPRFVEPYAGELQAVVDYYSPTGDADIYFTVVDSQNENWSAQEGTYDYSITWTAQPTGNCNLF